MPAVALNLDERLPLPAGLESQFDIYLGGGGGGNLGCGVTSTLAPPRPAPPSFVSDDAQVGSTTHLCGDGFDPARPVLVTIVDPAGTAVTKDVRLNTRHESGWSTRHFREPGSPTGEYRIEATQDGITTVTTFTVALITDPRLIVSTNQEDPEVMPARLDLGFERVARVFVVGYRPGTEVRTFLFAVEQHGDRADRVLRRSFQP